MSSSNEITLEYMNVIDWLNKNMKSDPFRTAKLISSHINLMTYAFDKTYRDVDQLVNSTDFDSLNKEEIKILKFYFELLEKQLLMN